MTSRIGKARYFQPGVPLIKGGQFTMKGSLANREKAGNQLGQEGAYLEPLRACYPKYQTL